VEQFRRRGIVFSLGSSMKMIEQAQVTWTKLLARRDLAQGFEYAARTSS